MHSGALLTLISISLPTVSLSTAFRSLLFREKNWARWAGLEEDESRRRLDTAGHRLFMVSKAFPTQSVRAACLSRRRLARGPAMIH